MNKTACSHLSPRRFVHNQRVGNTDPRCNFAGSQSTLIDNQMKLPYSIRLSALVVMLSAGICASDTSAQNLPIGTTTLEVAGRSIQVPYVGQAPTIDIQLLGGAPPNDNCEDVTPVVVPLGGSVEFVGDNTGASPFDFLGPVVWEAFTIEQCSDVTIDYCGTSPAFEAAYAFLFVGCPWFNLALIDPNTVSPFACGNGNFTIPFPGLPAGTYYYPVLEAVGASGPYVVTVTAAPCATPAPPNAECAGALSLTPSPVCNPTLANATGATTLETGLPAVTCSGFQGDAGDALWFSFVATATEHTIIVQGSDEYDAVIDVRNAPCGGGNLDCADNTGSGGEEELTVTDLTVGNTYYVRVYDWWAGTPVTPTFTICVLGPEPVCEAAAGALEGGGAVCLENDAAVLTAVPDGNAVVPSGYQTVYVLTEGPDLVIINAGAAPEFEVDATGTYTIHTLVYDPTTLDLGIVEFGVTTGFDVNGLLIQGGGAICASLDVAGAAFTVEVCADCDADAGTLSGGGVVCFEDGAATLSASPDGNAVVPDGYETVYVLTEGADLVIINAGAAPEFEVEATGTYTIHTLVYDPTTLDLGIVEFGVTTGFDVNGLLIQGGGAICASLDVAGAAFAVEVCADCDADAGTLSGGGVVCFEDGAATLSASPDGNAVVPDGYETVYVLTEGADLVIINAGAAPEFEVDATGTYTIHTLVYDPNTLDLGIVEIGVTTGFDVNGLLIQGGGAICASLDVAGAAFSVQLCCDADAGTITADEAEVCLEDDLAVISATPDGNAVIPDGFEVGYALTEGPGLVIVGLSGDPVFTVSATGSYTIHTLVYDPATIDLGIVELGVTTGFDVNGLLIQGGGAICASLDVAGAAFSVQLCCDADAGTITADEAEVCLEDDLAVISATPDGNAVIPDGFEVGYALTEGPGLVIVGLSGDPVFTVSATGSYTIHTLVYDPATIDLGIVELGVTTGFDVNGLLIQGGGEICASLDVAGAAINVVLCCDADAGTLSGGGSICYTGVPVILVAAPNDDAVVPDGFETVYVLTEGPDLVIIDVGADPEFEVDALGTYTIHTLVFDPNTLDLGIVEIGVTTGFDVNGLLIQGGGTICASLDVAGAFFEVIDCTPVNNSCGNATSLNVQTPENCPGNATVGDNTYATQTADEPGCDGTTEYLADVWYTFNSGPNTEVTITFDSGTMTDWVIVVTDACEGNELVCAIMPTDDIVLATAPDSDYIVRVYSNLQFGDPGVFAICVSAEVPTVLCDGGEVSTTDGDTALVICQDENADVLFFESTSTSNEAYTFILTDEDNAIVTALVGNSLDFNSAALGVYRVWGISHNGTLVGVLPGQPATGITTTGDCLELSANFVQVTVEVCTGVAENTENAWTLFPNPGNGDFTVRYSGPNADVLMEVTDMSGRVVFSRQAAMTTGALHQVQLAGRMAPGMYTVRFMQEGAATNLRLVVR
jgi:hypothetical protein